MKKKFERVVKYITGAERDVQTPASLHIAGQFLPEETGIAAISRNLNAAFLTALSGETHPSHKAALDYLDSFASHPQWGAAASFYSKGIGLIYKELAHSISNDKNIGKALEDLAGWIADPRKNEEPRETVEKIRGLFFPEGVSLCEGREQKIQALRDKRRVGISRLNTDPVTDPAGEVLFTSNILLTLPLPSISIDDLPVGLELRRMLKHTSSEAQMYWYDHPIPVGIPPEQNEVLYGLEGLDSAVEIEKQRGVTSGDSFATCVLSVSVTHKGLQGIAREYLESELKKEKNIQHLNVVIFTEADTTRLIDEILIPAAGQYTDFSDFSPMYEVIGVDGEYGRHYSFLKAVAAFWHIFIDPDIKGTFKIDLDQVFPQEELIDQSGHSAFEHLKTPLWGAEGTDSQGDRIELGMIAGALVNQKDIGSSLFTPDVSFPSGRISPDELVFFSRLPQALSTEAEMMTRYTDAHIDGKSGCIQRIHVTGGTSGILVGSLMKHRPFTPAFIGRAEDQAYLLSVLFEGADRHLRYVHKDGLIMRHDKEAFAAEAINIAATGKLIGDYVRILMFSYYARALPWPLEKIKDAVDPFTGCFISKIPLTVVHLRFALKAASFFSDETEGGDEQGSEFLQTGIMRLNETIGKFAEGANPLIRQYSREKHGWNMYYDILEKTAEGISEKDPFALELQQKARALVKDCTINF